MSKTNRTKLSCVPGSPQERMMIAHLIALGGVTRCPDGAETNHNRRHGGVMPAHLDPRFL